MKLKVTAIVLSILCALTSCSDSNSDVELVVDLSDSALQSLCEDFGNKVCTDLSECNPAYCNRAEVPNLMRSICVDPIKIESVNDCAERTANEESDAAAICAGAYMGGCVFDVFDELPVDC